MKKRAVIFANGHLPNLQAASRLLHPQDVIIAADGGTRHAFALGLSPSVVVGDLDSLAPDDRQRLQACGARIIAHPAGKDETDLELALRYVVGQGFQAVLVIAALGGRLDQTIGNLGLLAHPDLEMMDVRIDDGVEQVFLIRSRAVINGQSGDGVSLIPWAGSAEGVVTRGLRWALSGETLAAFGTRGLSNEMLAATARLSLRSGLLLCIHRRRLPE